MPSALKWLLDRLVKLIQTATASLEQSYPDGVQAWQDEIARQLARYHAAALMAGAGVDTLSPQAQVKVTQDLATQLKFLGKFGVEIQDGDQWERGWNSRAEMYAGSIKAPFYQGLTRMYPLPAMPADGTSQCLTRCLCSWELDEQPGDGNVDAYWRVSAAESCQTCLERGRNWAPLKVRDGVLQL
jgi:hypothetical protein